MVYGSRRSGYDEIEEPRIAADGVDYVVFTDRELPPDSLWQRRGFDYFHHDPDPHRAVRQDASASLLPGP